MQEVVLGKLDLHVHMYRTRPLPYTFEKNHTQWIKDLYLQYDIIALLEENIWKTLQDIGIGKVFLEKNPDSRQLKPK